ncbi:zf-HC2 domain-containing protein [Ideonella sp. 4Y11]|uniref:Zf-HC2 domain-containing protein n=1 Tax=Ideonella aquatica TaxID=2824119 RepID=A0A941BLF4_9BURK|nr:zf-HC2 domain-containing protein [Ideonella aquatica]MBQ0961377.1 zf-HC2 domain-containing protein [Ideonella aquatica]
MKPWLTCRQATSLTLLSQDRSLSWLQRLQWRAHLAMCDACARFSKQQDLIRGAMGPWRAYRDNERPGEDERAD